jgi:hypothetical protein
MLVETQRIGQTMKGTPMAASTKHSYPRAMPYAPPVANREQSPEHPRWSYRWTGLAALVLVGATAGAVVFFNQSGAEADAASPSWPEPAAKAPVKVSAPAKKAEASTLKDRYLEALGGLSASHLYQTYLNIGLLADSVEKEAYTQEEADKMLASVTDLMKLVDVQLAKVRQSDLTSDDQISLERIKAVMGLLRLQSETLQNYWDSGDENDAKQYHLAREAAWKGLSKVLGLEDAAN